MEFLDRTLKCVECGSDFVFTAGEQVFFHDKQFKNEPKHCRQCRAKRTIGKLQGYSETHVRCSECGIDTTVPFKPTNGRPVLCRVCFQKRRNAIAGPGLVEAPPPSPALADPAFSR